MVQLYKVIHATAVASLEKVKVGFRNIQQMIGDGMFAGKQRSKMHLKAREP